MLKRPKNKAISVAISTIQFGSKIFTVVCPFFKCATEKPGQISSRLRPPNTPETRGCFGPGFHHRLALSFSD
jgi:hypothetical protein